MTSNKTRQSWEFFIYKFSKILHLKSFCIRICLVGFKGALCDLSIILQNILKSRVLESSPFGLLSSIGTTLHSWSFERFCWKQTSRICRRLAAVWTFSSSVVNLLVGSLILCGFRERNNSQSECRGVIWNVELCRSHFVTRLNLLFFLFHI